MGRSVPTGDGLLRRLAVSSGVYAVGTGLFIAGNAVYFTHIVGLAASQVGLGLSVAGVVSLLVSVPAGRLADRLGTRRTWLLVGIGEALVYLVYPWVRGLGAFLAVVGALAIMEASGRAARGAYALHALPPDQRVRGLAWVRSSVNIGFTVGALISGLVLAAHDDRLVRVVPLVTAAVLVVDVLIVGTLPKVAAGPAAPRMAGHAALRNRPLVLLSFLNGQLGVGQVLLTLVFPLFVLRHTDAPQAVLAWLYGTNTVLVVLLQVRAARGVDGLPRSLRVARLAGLATALACLLVWTASSAHGAATLVVLWAAYVALTAAELVGSAASWGLLAQLTDPARRAEYVALWRMGTQFQMVVGPLLLTWLVVDHWPWTLALVAVWTVVVSLLMPVAARASHARLTAQTRMHPVAAGQ